MLIEKGISQFYINSTLYLPFYLISVLLICGCYILIVVKVRCSRRPYHHDAASLRERKLTGTSLTVVLVSLLSLLPAIIYIMMYIFQKLPKLSQRSDFHIRTTITSIFLLNSVVNPVIYAMLMPEFRAGVSQILCKTSNRQVQHDFPLPNLRPA